MKSFDGTGQAHWGFGMRGQLRVNLNPVTLMAKAIQDFNTRITDAADEAEPGDNDAGIVCHSRGVRKARHHAQDRCGNKHEISERGKAPATYWYRSCLMSAVAGFVFFLIGLLCALIGRVMLMVAAFRISFWWGLGVFLPFGPIFFRRDYPDQANPSRWFRLASLPCIFVYVLLDPNAGHLDYYRYKIKRDHPSLPTVGYATEATKKNSSPSDHAPQLSVAQRFQANMGEFDRLHRWNEALQLRKRDLLHSDAAGNRAYTVELARYNDALQKATAEKDSLSAGK